MIGELIDRLRRLLTPPEAVRSLWLRLVKNSSLLVGGAAGASVIGLVNIAIVARVLGPEGYGMVALIVAYAAIVDKLLNFQSWQPVVKYGAALLGDESRPRLAHLTVLAFGIDVATALLALVVAYAGSFLVFPLFDWDPSLWWLGQLYLVTLPFRTTGAARGLLRVFDRYDLIAKQSVWGPIVKLLLLGSVAALSDLDLLRIVLIYAAADMLANAVYVGYAFGELRRRRVGLRSGLRAVTSGTRPFPGFMRFLVSSNLNGTSKLAITDLDTLLSGVVIGTAAAGYYRLIKTVAKLLTKVSGPFYEALYPEFATLVHEHQLRRMRGVGRRLAAILGGVAMVGLVGFALVGRPLVELALGPEYLPIYSGFLLFGMGLVLQMFAVPVSAMVLALGLPDRAMSWYWAAAVVFTGTFVLFGMLWGLDGACAAFVVYWIIWLSGVGALVWRTLNAHLAATPA